MGEMQRNSLGDKMSDLRGCDKVHLYTYWNGVAICCVRCASCDGVSVTGWAGVAGPVARSEGWKEDNVLAIP